MPTTSHPVYANHTHRYTCQNRTGTAEIKSFTLKTCPSGHTNCQLNTDYGLQDITLLDDLGEAINYDGWWAYWNSDTITTYWLTDADITSLGLNPDTYSYAKGSHFHTYNILYPKNNGDVTNMITHRCYRASTSPPGSNCALSHTDCVHSGSYAMADGEASLNELSLNAFLGATNWPYYINNTESGLDEKVANANTNHRHYYLLVQETHNYYFVTSLKTCPKGHTNCQTDDYTQCIGWTTYVSIWGDGYTSDYTSYTNVSPSVTTLPATSISQHNATLNGEVTIPEVYEGEYYCGFQYKKSTGGTHTVWYNEWFGIPEDMREPITASQEFYFNALGLDYNTTYSFRAVATDGEGNYWYGSWLNFTTEMPLPIFGETEGYRYVTARQAIDEILKASTMKAYINNEGSFKHE